MNKLENLDLNTIKLVYKNNFTTIQNSFLATQSTFLSDIYKNLNLNCKSNWGGFDFSSKLLGTYEEQVQQKIRDIAFKNK